MKRKVLFSLLQLSRDYPLREFKPLVDTLRKTDYDGEFIIFVNNLDKKAHKYFKENNVKVIPFSYEYPYLKGNKAILNEFKEFKNVKLNIFHHREFLPLLYLLDNKDKYDLVSLADSADVIFQKSPFDWDFDPKKIYFSLQDVKIKKSWKDSDWIETIYGKKELEKIWENNVCCTGTIVGGIESVINYLKLMAYEFKKGMTIDQGNHNYLVHNNKIKGQVLLNSQDGIMLTCSGSKRESFIFGKDKKIRSLSGSIYTTVHQYDTYPDWSFHFRGICIRSIREYVKRIPVIGKILVDFKSLFVKSYVHFEKE